MNLDADVRRLIKGTNYAHIATVLPDGAPHAVPMWVDMEGEHIAVLTDPRSVKARNLERDPRVALSIIDQESPNVMAHIRGRLIATVDGDAGWAIIDRLAHKYVGTDYPLRTDRVALLIEPHRAWAQSF
jgi:PPOX class probable F420-dependent enzyme